MKIKNYAKQLLITAIFLNLLMGAATPVSAQPVVFDWAIRLGNVDDDKGNGIVTDAAGNIYTIGNFYGTVDFDPGPLVLNLVTAGYTDIFVSKTDPAGNLIWARQFGGSVHDNGAGIAVDAAGNVYTTGNFENTSDFDPGPNTFNLTSAGGFDVFVSKLDASGNFVWAKQMGGSQISSINGDEGKSVAVDASGNVYVGGRFEFMADFDPGPGTFNLTAAGSSCDVFLAKLTSQGDFVWAKKWGDNGNTDWLNNIAVSGIHIYSSGSFYGPVDFDPGPNTTVLSPGGLSGIYVSKLDSAGDFVWARQFSRNMGGFLYDAGAMTVDNQGNVFTTGSFDNTVDFDPGNGNANMTAGSNQNAFIVKLNSSGSYQWVKSLGNTGEVAALGITLDSQGSIYTTGWFNDNGNAICDFDPGAPSYIVTSHGLLDIFVCKLDASGNFNWAKGMGGPFEDYGLSIAVSPSYSVSSTGYFSGTADFDPDTNVTFNLTGAGSTDLFIHKMNQIGVGIEKTGGSNMLRAFPNPSEGIFTFASADHIIAGTIEVYNHYGAMVYAADIRNRSSVEMDLKNLHAGIYFLRLREGMRDHGLKLVIQ